MIKRVNDYEYKIEIITKEIERLNSIIETKNREIQTLQAKCVEGDNSSRQLKNLNDNLRKILD